MEVMEKMVLWRPVSDNKIHFGEDPIRYEHMQENLRLILLQSAYSIYQRPD